MYIEFDHAVQLLIVTIRPKKINLALFDSGDIQFGIIRFSRCGLLFDQAAIDTWTVISIVNIYIYINYNLEISSIFGICSISL